MNNVITNHHTVTDLTGGKARTTAVCLFESFWSLGVIVLPLLAYIMPDWSNLYLMISLPTCLYVMLWMLIPESPRWLLMHGEPELAKAELLRGAAYNGRQVDESPAALDERLRAYVINGKKEQEQDGRNWWSLWRGRHSVIAIVAAHIAWAVYVTNYNGMLLNVKAYGRDFLSLNTVIMGTSAHDALFLLFDDVISLFVSLIVSRKCSYLNVSHAKFTNVTRAQVCAKSSAF